MLAIRSYMLQDRDETIGIFLKAIQEISSREYNPKQIDAWAHVEDHDAWGRKRASKSTWIATYNTKPVGFSDLEPSGYLDMMFVHPRYQGLGVATLLMKTIEAAALEQDLKLITTNASLTARPFFLSKGFTIVASQEVQIRGQMLRNFRMEKRFTEAL